MFLFAFRMLLDLYSASSVYTEISRLHNNFTSTVAWISPVNNACILKHFNGIIYPIWIAWTIPSVVCASDILKFPRGWHVYLALNDHPNRESIFQRKEIQRRFILPLYPEKSQHKPKAWNVPEKIINNSNIPPIGEILCANYHRF